VVGGTGVNHQVRDRGGWGQRHRGGVGKRLRVPPISPGPPHGLGRRPRKGKEPLLRLGRCGGRCRRWSGKEDRLRGGGARGRGTRGRPGPHVDGASPQVVERWSLGTTQRAASATRRATVSTLATTTPPPRASRLPKSSRRRGPKCGEEEPPPPRRQRGKPEERCRASWRERWSQWRRGEAPREADRSWSPQRLERASCE
jgi:hypothetical protein